MNYRIKEVFIQNFKSIDEWYLDLNDTDLTVLDGPNGFGKTSIFDAIELMLTGSIRRIINNNITSRNKGFEDYLYAKNQSNPIIIKISLQNELQNKDIVIGRKINHNNYSSIEKRPDSFNNTIHRLETIKDNLEANNEINNIKEIIDLEELENAYGLYNYIEQEESSHFLKQSEIERMNTISTLFNIDKEEGERKKLERTKNILDNNLKTLENQLKKYEEKFESNKDNEPIKEVKYFQILPDKVNQKEIWDQKFIGPIDIHQKKVYFYRIDTFEYLLQNISSFKMFYHNEGINQIINNDSELEKIILLYHFYDNRDAYHKEHNLKQKIINFISLLKKRDIINKKIEWELIYEYFDMPITYEGLQDKLTIIRNHNNHSNQISNMITSLLSTRKTLEKNLKDLVKHDCIRDNSCPLCGKEWRNKYELIEQINNQTKFLEEQLDESASESSHLLDEIYITFTNRLIQEMIRFTDRLIDTDIYNLLSKKSADGFEKSEITRFMDKLDIEIDDIVYRKFDNLKDFDDLSLRINSLRDKLIKKLYKDINFDYEKYELSKDIYKNSLEENDLLLNQIDESKFESKKLYINYLYFLQANTEYENYTKLKKNYDKINSARTSIKESMSVYTKKINAYNSKMISEIEIPFFIYTGKILQHYQRGFGVFLHEQKNNKQGMKMNVLRFVPPQKTDHDILHTFSSGQLSATVISLTLALNKVYNNSNIKTLLIDDPVQTMDEMNMVSFVELLRNDFKNYQLILSTHDEHTSLYMRYKFSKYGYQTKRINVKEEMYR